MEEKKLNKKTLCQQLQRSRDYDVRAAGWGHRLFPAVPSDSKSMYALILRNWNLIRIYQTGGTGFRILLTEDSERQVSCLPCEGTTPLSIKMMSRVYEIYIHTCMYVCEGVGFWSGLEERTCCEVVKGVVSILNSGGIAAPGDIYRLANYSRVLITCTHHIW